VLKSHLNTADSQSVLTLLFSASSPLPRAHLVGLVPGLLYLLNKIKDAVKNYTNILGKLYIALLLVSLSLLSDVTS